MPWYYAGPDSQPVGPITLEELQTRRTGGIISPETYVIEHTGVAGSTLAWKRYKELFPAIPSLPAPPLATPPPPFPLATPAHPPVQSHPLFPSAAAHPGASIHHPAPLLPPVNSWCSWGFGLALTSLILLLITCGLAAIFSFPLALAALVISCVGLTKIQHNPAQGGRNLAFGGLFISGATLLIVIVILAVAIPAILKGRGLITTTEQSTSDS